MIGIRASNTIGINAVPISRVPLSGESVIIEIYSSQKGNAPFHVITKDYWHLAGLYSVNLEFTGTTPSIRWLDRRLLG